MAIQQRRGAKADFDATKMLPGELAVTTDGSRKVYVAFAPGDAKELASTEEVEEIIQGGIEEIEQKKEEALAQFPNYEDKIKELEIYKANSIISTSSGTVFHETDCAAVPPINIKLYGKSKQVQYKGNQLFDISKVGNYSNNAYGNVDATLTNNGDGSLSVKLITSSSVGDGRALKDLAPHLIVGETYTLNANVSGTSVKLIYITDVGSWEFGKSKVITQAMLDGNVRWYADVGGSVATISDIMLNKGTTALPWEPYVGGEQSPNMNYPQIPEFLGESGSIGGKVYSGNLVPPTQNASKTVNGITFDVLEDGWIHVHGTSTAQAVFNYIGGWEQKSGINIPKGFVTNEIEGVVGFCFYGYNESGEYTQRISKAQEDFTDIYLYLEVYGGNTVDVMIRPYACKEVVATDYAEPQPFTFQTPNGLRGIPLGQTIPDAIKNSPIHMSGVYWDNAEQQYYIGDTKNENGKDVQRIFKERLLADRVNIIDSLCNEESNLFYIFLNTKFSPSYEGNFICDIATYNHRMVDGTDTNNGGCLNVVSNNLFYIRIRKDYGVTTLDEFKEYLENNEVYIYIIFEEPIITESTDQYDVVMNYPNTTIVNDEGAYMEVTHVKDTQKHIEQNYVSKEAYNEHENRIAELEKAIVNS